jgi:hypothetical protein
MLTTFGAKAVTLTILHDVFEFWLRLSSFHRASRWYYYQGDSEGASSEMSRVA